MPDKFRYTASLYRTIDIEVECEYDSQYNTVDIIRAYDPITEKPIELEDNEKAYCRGEACDEWIASVKADEADNQRAARKEDR